MRNERCRVTIIHASGHAVGRGFIADPGHTITCRHVAQFGLGREPVIGDRITVQTDDGATLAMQVVKLGDATQDVCVLERIDGGSFAPTDCALWAPGEPGEAFIGLGMSEKFEGIALSGKLQTTNIGGVLQFVTADDGDNRIEKGCSGAPLFVVPGGSMVGMVVSFQQNRSGQIFSATALARFWPLLAAFNPAPTEGFPSLVAAPPSLPPVDLMIREVDRTAQKRDFRKAIENAQLLKVGGFVFAAFAALPDDLPDACVDSLYQSAISPIMQKLAPDSVKTVEPSRLSLRDVIGDGTAVRENLLDLLRNSLNASSSKIEDVRAALRSTLTPLTIVLNAMLRDLDLLTPAVLQMCADTIRDLAIPEDQPVAVFIYILAPDEASLPDIGSRLGGLGTWYVPLTPLSTIMVNDVTNLTGKYFVDRPAQDRARDTITDIITKNCGGRQEFRLKELKSWLSAVN